METMSRPRVGRHSGFTIVELLIVVVVISILAAIAIASYGGIQKRAQNTSRISAAKQASNLINSYTTTTGAYPDASGASFCVGRDFVGGNCWGVDSGPPYGSPTLESSSVAFNNTLSTVGRLSSISYPTVDMGYWRGIGPVYHYRASRTVDGVSKPAILIYFLDGVDLDCGLDNVLKPTTTGTPGQVENDTIFLSDTTVPRNSATNGAGTYCIISLSRP